MIEINGKEYRNIQEQVEKNKDDIADLGTSIESLDTKVGDKYLVAVGIYDTTLPVGVINHNFTEAELTQLNEMDWDVIPDSSQGYYHLEQYMKLLVKWIHDYKSPVYGYNNNLTEGNIIWEAIVENRFIHIEYVPGTTPKVTLQITNIGVNPQVVETKVTYDSVRSVIIFNYDTYPLFRFYKI